MPQGRGREDRLRHSGRGEPRPHVRTQAQRHPLHPNSSRAGRRLHGRCLRPPHGARRCVPRHAWPWRHEPRHRRGRRLPRRRAARGHHGPGLQRAHAVHEPPVPGPLGHVLAYHEALQGGHAPGYRSRDLPSGLQVRRGPQARCHPHRPAQERGAHAQPGAPAAQADPAGALRGPSERHRGRQAHLRAQEPPDPRWRGSRARQRERGRALNGRAPAHPGGADHDGQGRHPHRLSVAPGRGGNSPARLHH